MWKQNNKYHAAKVVTPDGTFDSAKEAKRWAELKLLARAGKIDELERQVKFVLIPTQYEGTGKSRRVAERECAYIADFVYRDIDTDKVIVEDTKGYKTTEYIIKRKLMRYLLHINIREV